MRDEGSKVIQAIEEAVTVGKEAGVPVEFLISRSTTRASGARARNLSRLVEKFRREGVDVVVDQYPYERSSTNLGITLPSWALADGEDAIRKRIADPEVRARIIDEMQTKLASIGQKDYSYATVAGFRQTVRMTARRFPRSRR